MKDALSPADGDSRTIPLQVNPGSRSTTSTMIGAHASLPTALLHHPMLPLADGRRWAIADRPYPAGLSHALAAAQGRMSG